jgi:hypothetical protein
MLIEFNRSEAFTPLIFLVPRLPRLGMNFKRLCLLDKQVAEPPIKHF